MIDSQWRAVRNNSFDAPGRRRKRLESRIRSGAGRRGEE